MPDIFGRPLLVFLPFAGANAYAYRPFQSLLVGDFELLTPELPGRGSRLVEPFLHTLEAAATDVLHQIGPALRASQQPFYIFGHSMGSLLAYLVIQKLFQQGHRLPAAVFLCGMAAPGHHHRKVLRHQLPRLAFKQELRRIGGSPNEILDQEEVFDFFEPILRADFKLVELHQHLSAPPLPGLPLHVLLGSEDQVSLAQGQAWQEITTGPVTVNAFAGNHFFLFDHTMTIVALIRTVAAATGAHG